MTLWNIVKQMKNYINKTPLTIDLFMKFDPRECKHSAKKILQPRAAAPVSENCVTYCPSRANRARSKDFSAGFSRWCHAHLIYIVINTKHVGENLGMTFCVWGLRRSLVDHTEVGAGGWDEGGGRRGRSRGS